MNLEEQFLAHYRPLCLYALHYVQDVDTAEDVVQDAFVGLIEKEKEGTAVGNVRAYLYAMVRNRCVDLIRKARHAYIDGDVSPQDLSGSISDEEAQERSLHEAELWTAIDALPSRCREVFLRAKRDGMTYSEIARTMGIAEKTVEHQMSKALKTLRGKKDDYFYTMLLMTA